MARRRRALSLLFCFCFTLVSSISSFCGFVGRFSVLSSAHDYSSLPAPVPSTNLATPPPMLELRQGTPGSELFSGKSRRPLTLGSLESVCWFGDIGASQFFAWFTRSNFPPPTLTPAEQKALFNLKHFLSRPLESRRKFNLNCETAPTWTKNPMHISLSLIEGPPSSVSRRRVFSVVPDLGHKVRKGLLRKSLKWARPINFSSCGFANHLASMSLKPNGTPNDIYNLRKILRKSVMFSPSTTWRFELVDDYVLSMSLFFSIICPPFILSRRVDFGPLALSAVVKFLQNSSHRGRERTFISSYLEHEGLDRLSLSQFKVTILKCEEFGMRCNSTKIWLDVSNFEIFFDTFPNFVEFDDLSCFLLMFVVLISAVWLASRTLSEETSILVIV